MSVIVSESRPKCPQHIHQ